MTASIKNDYARAFISEDWTDEDIKNAAIEEGITLTEDHFSVVHALREFFSRHDINHINLRELHDALRGVFGAHRARSRPCRSGPRLRSLRVDRARSLRPGVPTAASPR